MQSFQDLARTLRTGFQKKLPVVSNPVGVNASVAPRPISETHHIPGKFMGYFQKDLESLEPNQRISIQKSRLASEPLQQDWTLLSSRAYHHLVEILQEQTMRSTLFAETWQLTRVTCSSKFLMVYWMPNSEIQIPTLESILKAYSGTLYQLLQSRLESRDFPARLEFRKDKDALREKSLISIYDQISKELCK